MQLLERLLKNYESLGSGAYSAVFDTKDGSVIKVPLRQYDGQEVRNRFGTVRERIFTAKSLYESTKWLHSLMGDIITPVALGPGGTLRQKKLMGRKYHDFGYNTPIGNRIADDIERIQQSAFELEKQSGRESLLDTSHANFMLDDAGRILAWYDPFVPTENPYSPWYKERKEIFDNEPTHTRSK